MAKRRSYTEAASRLRPGRSTTYLSARGVKYRLYKSKVTNKVTKTPLQHISGQMEPTAPLTSSEATPSASEVSAAPSAANTGPSNAQRVGTAALWGTIYAGLERGLPRYRFNQMDTNHDDKVSIGEWNADHGSHYAVFGPTADTSGDGVLSFYEFLKANYFHCLAAAPSHPSNTALSVFFFLRPDRNVAAIPHENMGAASACHHRP